MTRRNPEADGPYVPRPPWEGWAEIDRKWRAVMLDRSNPPTDEPVWIWDEWYGWLRRAARR